MQIIELSYNAWLNMLPEHTKLWPKSVREWTRQHRLAYVGDSDYPTQLALARDRLREAHTRLDYTRLMETEPFSPNRRAAIREYEFACAEVRRLEYMHRAAPAFFDDEKERRVNWDNRAYANQVFSKPLNAEALRAVLEELKDK